MTPSSQRKGIVAVIAVTCAAVAGWFLANRGPAIAPQGAPAPPPSSPPSSGGGGIAERIVAMARQYAPTSYGTDAWTQIMGAPMWAPGKWAYYEDHYGTTCGVFVAFILAMCGIDPRYINRKPPEGTGFKIGDHIAKLERGGMATGDGALIRDANLQPGDIYRATHASGEHVGIVLSRTVNAKGETILETADGGQQDSQGRQCSKLCVRRLTGSTLRRIDEPGSDMTVTWRLHFT